jgi:hypothetical protein
MRALALGLICALAGGVAFAQDAKDPRNPSECMTAAGVVLPDFGLPHVAQAIGRKKLDIAVIGSGSSELNGPGGTSIAYPVRLETALGKLLPGVAVKVSTFAKPRETAAEMEKKLGPMVAAAKPALVVWQTGTVDAIRGVDPDEFRMSLDDGVNAIEAAKADLIFMNMQYSPRTEDVLAVGPFADAMRIIALQREVVLFDRFSIMERWNESKVFDLYARTRTTDVAERVHDCLGRLLAKVVVAGAKMAISNKTAP